MEFTCRASLQCDTNAAINTYMQGPYVYIYIYIYRYICHIQ